MEPGEKMREGAARDWSGKPAGFARTWNGKPVYLRPDKKD